MRPYVVIAACLLIGASAAGQVCLLNTEAAKLLNRWFAEGSASGNGGDWYDNRDRAHSQLKLADYPQLKAITYTQAQKKQNLDLGLQRGIHRDKVVIGSSSTSAPVTQEGSNGRIYYFGGPPSVDFLYGQYRSNQLYVYPEHHDHDAGHNGSPGYGDLFPMNTPYLVISQGSSFSDKPFISAFAQTLAAFKPEVKSLLVNAGLLMPTLQQVFRRSNKNIRTNDDYLSGKAHPTVFDGRQIDVLKMVGAAHAMGLRDIPPLIQIGVEEENIAVNGRDFFELRGDERLADSPCAIARVFRRHAATMRLLVSAEKSADPFGEPLSYHWKLLRGDPDHVTITTRKNGAVAEIVVRWPEWRPIAAGSSLESNRIDVGVFVDNGRAFSAPGFVSVVGLDSEFRTFDAMGRTAEIDYHARDMRFDLPPTNAVVRWAAFFDVAESSRKEFGRRLLERSLDAAAVATLENTSKRYASIAKRFREVTEGIEKINQNLADAVADAKWQLDHAKGGPAKVNAMKAHKAAVAAQRGKNLDREELEQTLKGVKNESSRLIRDSGLRQKLSSAFRELVGQPDLYLKNREDADRAVGGGFKDALERAIALGFYKIDERLGEDHLELRSVTPGSGDVLSRLTRMEREQLRYLNQMLLADLFPAFILAGSGAQFSDSRVTTPKNWRDVFHYDAKGQLTGWARFHLGRAVEYTAHGHLVLEKDDRGRPLRARAVSSVLDRDGTLTIHPANRSFRYEYRSEVDRVGTPRPELGQ